MNDTIRLLKSKRQSFEWRSSYAEKFTDAARAAYTRSATILFPKSVYLSTSQVLEVYGHAINSLEANESPDWKDLDSHGAPSHAEIRHSGGH